MGEVSLIGDRRRLSRRKNMLILKTPIAGKCRRHLLVTFSAFFLLWLFFLVSNNFAGPRSFNKSKSDSIPPPSNPAEKAKEFVAIDDEVGEFIDEKNIRNRSGSIQETTSATSVMKSNMEVEDDDRTTVLDKKSNPDVQRGIAGNEDQSGVKEEEDATAVMKPNMGVEDDDRTTVLDKKSNPDVQKGTAGNEDQSGVNEEEAATAVMKPNMEPEDDGRTTVLDKKSNPDVQKETEGNEDQSGVKEEEPERQVSESSNQEPATEVGPEFDPCSGRYIYIHEVPKKFHEGLLKNCRSLSNWTDMCEFTANFGLGPRLPNTDRVFSNTGWFSTNQFSLEIIFHNRMKQYDCLTKDSSVASAIFVPYYVGLDIAQYLWGSDVTVKDGASLELLRWLREKPEWKRMWGRDHFLVAGRITWDFRRYTDDDTDWGTKFLYLPEPRNMTNLVIESSPWNNNDFAIPYPTYFHPKTDNEVHQWQNRMRRQKRRILFSFVGAPRRNLPDSIRNFVIDQCQSSKRKCRMLECVNKTNRCHKPVYVMKMFQNSVFCLQPQGDSYTRRSAFDSILAGCIPVFFHPGSAYIQYLWHLPKDYTRYSVFIPENEVKEGKVSIENVLQQIPRKNVRAMREEVVRLIPKIIYADPRYRLETLEDAFDITITGVLKRVEMIRKAMAEGNDSSFDYPEKYSWKFDAFGTTEQHEWDPFFY